MTEMLLGAAGALVALMLLGIGFAVGWKASRWATGGNGRTEESSEEERRRLMAEQKAFHQIMNYNAETAYGMNGRQLEEDSR